MISRDKNDTEGRIEITYYTDPLCCWSWALESHWQKLKQTLSGKLVWNYRMGGLIADWQNYNDPLNTIKKPVHMGPLWMEASQISGVYMNDRIWVDDPPASSYPSCIAVKCAELQSAVAGEKYLEMLREAVMVHGKNIAKREVLITLAKKLSEKHFTIFDFQKFESDLQCGAGTNAFREDLQKINYNNISRFPTLILKGPVKPDKMIVGYRPYEVLLTAVLQVMPKQAAGQLKLSF